jgi:hypothetical protein
MTVEPALTPIAAWESFYVIVGSSAAALTGLQFVVIALGAETRLISSPATRAFATPTIVHFCAVLLVSAILSAPWHTLNNPAIADALLGIMGVVYTITIIRHARRQTSYAMVAEDWIFHVVLPFLAYAALLGGAIGLSSKPEGALFVIGAAAVLLLFIGIHNAWDSATYIAANSPRGDTAQPKDSTKSDG